MNNLPLELDHKIYNYLCDTSLYDLSLTNNTNYDKTKTSLKKRKIKSKISELNLSNNTKKRLIGNISNTSVSLDHYERHIDNIKKIKMTRYTDG